MIHKFILGRCVQCNLPQGDLERDGWECHGHVKSVSKTVASTPLTETPRVLGGNDGGSQDAPSQGATNQETPVQAATIQEVNSYERVTALNSDSTSLSERARGTNRTVGRGTILVVIFVLILIFIAGITVFKDGKVIQAVADPNGLIVLSDLSIVQRIDEEVQNDTTLNSVVKQMRDSSNPEVLIEVVGACGRSTFNRVQERYIQAGLVARVPEYSRVSLTRGFKNYLGYNMVKLEVLDGPSAGFHGYAYDVANAFRDVVQDDAAKLEKQLAEKQIEASKLAREQQAREREQISREQEQKAREQKERERETSEQAAREQATRERTAREQVAREQAASEASREQEAREKEASEQMSSVPKALPVETAPIEKQATDLGDERGKPDVDEIVLFEEHFTKSGNSPDPRLQSNACFSFKGDKKYRFKRDKGLFPTEKGVTLKFRWNAPKPNMPKSLEPGTLEPESVILQVDVYDVSGSRIMYQPQVKASLDWQVVNVPIMVPFNAESILIWNKWEDVEMYVDDVKIVTSANAPSEKQAADLITAFLKHGEEPNIQTELADYADTVNPYFDQGQQTKAAILKDITDYRAKWPKRSLQLIAIESARLVRMNILEATYRLRYSASNGKQNRSGALIQEIRFTLADQTWLVSGIRTVRQVVDVDQHQPEAFTTKEKKAASLVTAFLKHSESPDAQVELADYADIVDPYFYSKRQTKAAILKDITAYRTKWPKISLQLIDIDSVSSDRDDILNVTCRVRYSASAGLRNRSGTLVQRICFTQADKRWLISGVEIVQRMNSDGKVQDAEQSDSQQRQGGPPPQIRLGDVLEFFGRWGER